MVSHTVLATPRLGPRAYASSGLRQGFANPGRYGARGHYCIWKGYYGFAPKLMKGRVEICMGLKLKLADGLPLGRPSLSGLE